MWPSVRRGQSLRRALQVKPGVGRAKRMRRYEEGATNFLNVDLDIWSDEPLGPLVKALGRDIFDLHVGPEGALYSAHLEVSGSIARGGAEGRIREFVRRIEALPARARRLWDGAQRREFNIGIDAGWKPRVFELKLQPTTLRKAALAKAGIVITIYAVREDKRPTNVSGTGRSGRNKQAAAQQRLAPDKGRGGVADAPR